MKVDTNTKGNTYWFMFKVTNFRVGMRYQFNLMNFTRSIEKFYKEKMNIVTKAEAVNPQYSFKEEDIEDISDHSSSS